MAAETTDTDAWITLMSAVLDLDVPEEFRPGVATNLKTAAKMAAMLETAPVDDRQEPAPVFRA